MRCFTYPAFSNCFMCFESTESLTCNISLIIGNSTDPVGDKNEQIFSLIGAWISSSKEELLIVLNAIFIAEVIVGIY